MAPGTYLPAFFVFMELYKSKCITPLAFVGEGGVRYKQLQAVMPG